MSDSQLADAICRGDEAAIRQAINRYSRLLWSICGAILGTVGTTADIEECVADVFVCLWQNPGRFDASRGKLKTYLSIVARSMATDRYRQLSRRSAIPLDEALPAGALDIADELLSRDAKRALIAAVGSLSEPDREILVRRYCCEQKPRQIALALGMPAKQVENRLYCTKRRLRQALTEQERSKP